MDLVEKNIALTQEHKVLEALMKLRNISKFFLTMKIIATVCGLCSTCKNIEIRKVKNQQKKVKD